MGHYFTALVLDALRGWIGSSESNTFVVEMSPDEVSGYHAMKARHEAEEQQFLRAIFTEG